jgi:DNA-binding CsgD family transcriptional regulator/PAS domain-containing protein
MYSEETLLRLVERIYDAALAPELWPTFLESLSEVVDGHAANIAHKHTGRSDFALGATARFDPEAFREYENHYSLLDPWVKSAAARGLSRTGAMETSNHLIPASEYHRTEFYNDFGLRYGINGGCSVIIRLDQHVTSVLSVTQRGREFGQPELALLKRLLPHLQRALQIHERLAVVGQQRSAAEEIIDRLPFGVVMVDASGAVVLVNRAAEHIFATHDGLELRDRRMFAATTPQSTELRALVAGAVGASCGKALGAGGAIAIVRPSSKRPFQVLVTPMRTTQANPAFSSAGSAAIFISDPDLQPLNPQDILRELYAFTPAETRFAVQLLQHKSVAEAASFLNISLNTAHTHLKKLFDKTTTRRQSELLRLLGAGVGQLLR